MPLQITQREREGVILLDMNGRLVAGVEASLLRETVKQLAVQPVNLILNLAGVDYIDSTGLGGLVISFTSVRKTGGTVKLLNLSRRNIELLVLTKLETVFEVFMDEQDAINSFFPEREVKKFDILAFVQSHTKD
jgi:anti-sigma B factor antagonist